MIALAPICLPFTLTKTKRSFLCLQKVFFLNPTVTDIPRLIQSLVLHSITILCFTYSLSALSFATSMANSPASKSATAKQLKEHLQEQQEPFTLNIFLSEREYLAKCCSNGRNGCCQINLFKNLKRPRSYNLINTKMVSLSARVVKSILYKLVSANDDSQGEVSCCSNEAHQDEFQTSNGFTEVKGLITTIGASPSCNVEEGFLPSKYEQPGSSSATSQASNLGHVEPEKTLFTDKTPAVTLMNHSMIRKVRACRRIFSSEKASRSPCPCPCP